ncbi:uncharacterized protein LOC130445385 [Diorhabda sublineata]|uniref:uncharacterized protein LOC130445385 n=1 Tax=Diorhabda sublineata TaxID=1163346 RepID=UPI0024E0E9C7|nr:uncharacterized protein LOC130445385 [Diorhabda sublineata]
MENVPKASSTPKIIKGRPSIRTMKLVQSPIENRLEERSNSEQDVSSFSSSEGDGLSDENDLQGILEANELKRRRIVVKELEDRYKSGSHKVKQEKKQINEETFSIYVYLGIFSICALLLGFLYLVPRGDTVNGQITFENLENEFFSQQKDFWLSVKVAINDIIELNQPKSVIFLYKDVNTITNLLKKVSEFASLRICNSDKPLNISGNYLRRKEILEDYGKFIVEVRSKLKTKCVVIINNLDEVPGTSAQAFHSLCDEYNPVEEKVLFLFTLKVDEFPKNNYKFVEQKLKELWSDLHGDKFYPLYTRISIFILPVMSEN